MRNDTQISSSESFKQLSPKKLAAKMAEILDVVSMCHRAGLPDLSLSEIQQAYERHHQRRIDLNRVSARVYDLVRAERLVRLTETRACRVTGRNVLPVYVKPLQSTIPGI
jgi:hypothetical protein